MVSNLLLMASCDAEIVTGAYTVVFILTMWVLLRQRSPSQPVKKTMVGVSVIMFTLATMVKLLFCSLLGRM